jgi:hypothetical protein
MSRLHRLRAVLLGLSAVLWARPGLAQNSPGLVAADFTIRLLRPDDSGGWVSLTNMELRTYINQARCQCNTKIGFEVQMAPSSRSKLSSLTATGSNARLYVGANCAQLNATDSAPQCPSAQLLARLDGLASLASSAWISETTVGALFAGVSKTYTDTLTTAIWLWLDSTGAGYPDSGVSGISAPYLGIMLDGTPPPAPSGIVVEGGDKSLTVSWASTGTEPPDLAGYLVFCMGADGQAVFKPSRYNNQYFTGQNLCAANPIAIDLTGSTTSLAGSTTATEVSSPAVFQNLDPAYLCSDLFTPSVASARIRIPQNGVPYSVGVAAVDNSGNISPITSAFVQAGVASPDDSGSLGDDPSHPGPSGGLASTTPACACRLGSDARRPGASALLVSAGLVALSIVFRRRRKHGGRLGL